MARWVRLDDADVEAILSPKPGKELLERLRAILGGPEEHVVPVEGAEMAEAIAGICAAFASGCRAVYRAESAPERYALRCQSAMLDGAMEAENEESRAEPPQLMVAA